MIVGVTRAIAPEPTMQRLAPSNQQPEDKTSDALDRLGNFAESAAQTRKALAEQRLRQLREQMNKLALFDLAPGVLAGQSAQLAKELKAAATDFAGAFHTLAGIRQPVAPEMSLAQQAYLDLDDAPIAVNPGMSTADHETATSFTDAARQIAGMAEKAAGRFTARDGAFFELSGSARKSASDVIDLMKQLGDTPGSRAFFW